MLVAPIPLGASHDVSGFDCGREELNTFLRLHALENQRTGRSRTYVLLDDTAAVGYYSLAPSAVLYEDAPARVLKGQPSGDVPCMLLARLAIDKRAQGRGLGSDLCRHALERTLAAHEIVGGRALLVHALDEDAMMFYMQFDMMPSPTHPRHLFLLFKDIRKLLRH